MKLSKNPVVAYQQGYREGLEHRRSDDTLIGFEFMQAILLTCLYNVNVDGNYLSKPKLVKLYTELQRELHKMKNSYIEPDGTISSEDKIDLLWAHDNEVRKRLNIPKDIDIFGESTES